jgi:hypothetical protein
VNVFGGTVTDGFKADCRAFIAARLHMTEADVVASFDEMQSPERPVKHKRKPKAQRIADLPVSKEAILKQMAKLQRELHAIGSA